MSARLEASVFLSPPKPIPASVPGWDARQQATWPATTSTLISAERDAILIDALMTSTESDQLAAWVRASGKNLTSVYITHGHADHFFGLSAVLAAFPAARAVSLAEIVPEVQSQVSPGYLAVWESFFPGQMVAEPPVPVALDGTELFVEGHVLRLLNVGRSDVELSSVVHVPDLATVVSGDVAYNGIHMWMAGSSTESRKAWLGALDRIEELGAGTILTGHKDPRATDDHAARILDESRSYIADFDQLTGTSDSPQHLVAQMMDRYGDRGNPYTLWVAAYDQLGEPAADGSEG